MRRLKETSLLFALLLSAIYSYAEEPSFLDLEAAVFLNEVKDLSSLESQLVQRAESQSLKSDYKSAAMTYYLLSHLYIRLFAADSKRYNLIDNAAKLADQAEELDATSEFGALANAEISSLLGKDEIARMKIKEAKTLTNGKSWRARFLTIRLDAGLGGVEATFKALKELLFIPEVNRKIILFYTLGLLRTSYSDQDQVKELMTIHAKIPDEEVEAQLANAFLALGLYQQALPLLNKPRKNIESDIDAQLILAVIDYCFLNKKKEALSKFNQLLAREEITQRQKERLFYNIGVIHLRKGEVKNADKFFLFALEQSVGGLELFFEIASAYFHLGLYADLDHFIDQVTDGPLAGRGEIFALKGELLLKKLHQPDKALSAYKKAIILGPESTR